MLERGRGGKRFARNHPKITSSTRNTEQPMIVPRRPGLVLLYGITNPKRDTEQNMRYVVINGGHSRSQHRYGVMVYCLWCVCVLAAGAMQPIAVNTRRNLAMFRAEHDQKNTFPEVTQQLSCYS